MAVSLIISAVYATGVFTNMTAQRDANVRVAGDGASIAGSIIGGSLSVGIQTFLYMEFTES